MPTPCSSVDPCCGDWPPAGSPASARVLRLLRDEVVDTMRQLGTPTLAAVTRETLDRSLPSIC